MKIKDFIESRNISYNAVLNYIKRHDKEFKGHIGRRNNIVLDEVAITLLNKKYPLISGTDESVLARCQIEIIQLEKQYQKDLQTIDRLEKQVIDLIVNNSQLTALYKFKKNGYSSYLLSVMKRY